MTAPLCCRERDLATRMRELETQLNSELEFTDQRLRFSRLELSKSKPLERWELRGTNPLGLVVPSGFACKVEVEGSEAGVVYLGYSESWIHVRGRAKRKQYRYKSSDLRFLLASTGDLATTLQVRLEWAGRDDDGGTEEPRALVFPGRGAAHPHWQVDLHEILVAAGSGTRAQVAEIDLAESKRVQEINLDAPARSIPTGQGPFFPWFHKVHLPARAMWHEDPLGPEGGATGHQHEPANGAQIDNWVLSAVRYLRDELSKYS